MSIHGQLHPVVVVNFLLYKLSLMLNTRCFLQNDLFLLLFMFQEKSKVLGTFWALAPYLPSSFFLPSCLLSIFYDPDIVWGTRSSG